MPQTESILTTPPPVDLLSLSGALHVSFPHGAHHRILSFWDSFLLGRGESCDVRLDDIGISDRHAEVYRVDDLWWVRDLGSEDGTYLDEELIDAAPIRGAASLQLGEDGTKILLCLNPILARTSVRKRRF